MDDWYHMKQENILQNGGAGLLKYYANSTSLALQSVYPQHCWELERLTHKPTHMEDNSVSRRFQEPVDGRGTPKGFWTSAHTHRRFFDWLFLQLGFTNMEDWYQ